MKIVHFIDSFNQGGTERQAVQLVEMLHDEKRDEVFIAALLNDGIQKTHVDSIGLPAIKEYRLNSFYDVNFLKQVARCTRFLRANKIEVVHTHDFYTNIFGMISAFLARVPLRVASRRETTGIRSTKQKKLERLAYKFAHVIVANAEAVREQLIKEGIDERKVEVIYNGLSAVRESSSGPLGLNHDRNQILTGHGLPTSEKCRFVTIVANFRLEVKDQSTFLKASAQVRSQFPEACFVLIGEGPLIDSMKHLSKELGIEDAAFFMGQVDAVAELLSISNVCVLSSKAEGLPNAILEYMAAGKPVVATDVGGAREMICHEETGYLVDAGDYESMAARICELLRNPDRALAFGKLGKDFVFDRFSCSNQLRKTRELYGRRLGNVGQSNN